MPLKTKLLKSISGSENDPQSWADLTGKEKGFAKASAGIYAAAAVGFAVSFAAAVYEIRNTPEGCTAVLFPEQTFIRQPEHCHKHRRGRSPTGLGF